MLGLLLETDGVRQTPPVLGMVNALTNVAENKHDILSTICLQVVATMISKMRWGQ